MLLTMRRRFAPVTRREGLRLVVGGTAALSLTSFIASSLWAAPWIGLVEGFRLYAYGTPEGSKRDRLHPQTAVYQQELVETAKGGGLHLRFEDDTQFRLGEQSEAVLDKFVYNPDAGSGAMVVNLSKGAFRFITGKLDKTGFRVVTPTAVIGVHGTDFVVAVGVDGTTSVSVNEGEVEVTSLGGGDSAVVSMGLVATVSATGASVGVSEGGSVSGDSALTETGMDSSGSDASAGGGGDGGGGGGGCFTADTGIWMADGSHKRIADIVLGDVVLSYDFLKNERVASRVERLFSFQAERYLSMEGLEVTETHPFAVRTEEWVGAGDLRAGDKLIGEAGILTIDGIERWEQPTNVFNMTVGGTHNYYIAGADGARILVHNKD